MPKQKINIRFQSKMVDNYTTDITIIGAGPVGLFTVFEAGMLKMKCHVVDSLDFIGGQCTALYPEKPIYDIPAHPEISGEGLIKNLEQQILPFSPQFHLNQQVVSFEKDKEGIIITTSKNVKIRSKALIIAAGAGAFGPNRPPLENIENYENSSVFYMVGKKNQFSEKKIVIAGGGDSAVDWALSLSQVAEKIYLVHRRAKFRAAPDNIDKLYKLSSEGKIEILTPFQLHSLEGEGDSLQFVNIIDFDNNIQKLKADILLPFFGLAMELGPIANWGLELKNKLINVTQKNMRTNIDNVYAIGDMAYYENKLKLIVNGFAEATTACYDIYNLVYPDTPLHFEYSTTKGVNNV